MAQQLSETMWDELISGEELDKIAKIRSKELVEESIKNSQVDEYISKGWTVKTEKKTVTVVTKPKKHGDAWEDEVWTVFYKMGFKVMNASNQFKVVYAEGRNNATLTRQVDIVAIDDEVILLIECKEAEAPDTYNNWDDEINRIGNLQGKLFKEIGSRYPGRKCKHLFITKNYVLGEADKDRLYENKIIHMDQNAVLYYRKLSEQLKNATKYQLLGSIFAKTEIESLNTRVPAIKGSMGGFSYYTFLIEPATLLKIGYILHRTNANNDYDDLLPSYQRLIKKERLKSIREFVNGGGYFPNSLIVSLDVPKGKQHLKFEPASRDGSATDAKMGYLELPNWYQSCFIIDGQHRLYGYSDSNFAETNQVPVVAFENLSNEEQLKIFMDINENQKAVPPALRNILEIDIYKEHDDLFRRSNALVGYLAKRLGEDPTSKLYGRVVIGEDAVTDYCCITIENIKKAFVKTKFFNSYKKNGGLITEGIFNQNTLVEMNTKFYPFFKGLLTTFVDLVSDEWNATDSYLTKNNGIGMIIRILYDIVSIAINDNPELLNNMGSLAVACEAHVLTFADTIMNLSAEKKNEIKNARGTIALETPYRIVQMQMHEADASYTNESIDSYYIENGTNYNDEAKPMIITIRKALVKYVREVFTEDNWMSIHLSESHEKELVTRINNKQIQRTRNGENTPVDVWDELTIADILKIIANGSNWTNYFKDYFEQRGMVASKTDVMAKVKTVDSQNTSISQGKHITFTNFNAIKELCNVLSGGNE